jgi:hypothetical protein
MKNKHIKKEFVINSIDRLNKWHSDTEYLNSLDLEKTSDFLKYHQKLLEIMFEADYHTIKEIGDRKRKDLPNDLKGEFDRLEDNVERLNVVNSFIDEIKEVA